MLIPFATAPTRWSLLGASRATSPSRRGSRTSWWRAPSPRWRDGSGATADAAAHERAGGDRLGCRRRRPPVVLVHGPPFSSVIWDEVAAALAHRFRVYRWDLAGYGPSEQADGQDVSTAAQARILAALLGHWGVDEPDVVAHDIGGTLALRETLVEGRRYRRLGLADAVAVAPWGTGCFQLAKQHAEVLQAVIPGAELTVVVGAGHLLPLDAPATVAAEVASFLTA